MSGGKIDSLTGVRGYLALWVFSIHASIFFPGLQIFHNPFVANGYLGVDGFFILSGLVLYYVHGQEMRKICFVKAADFLVLRLARIYPLHLFMFMLFVVYALGSGASGQVARDQYSPQAALAHLTLTQAWFGNHRFIQTWNAPAWTISAEWAAYLLFPFLAWAASKFRPSILLVVSLTSLLVFELAYGMTIPNNVVRVVPEFVVGISLARIAAPSRLVAQLLFAAGLLTVVIGTVWGDTLAPVLGLAAVVYSLRTAGTLAAGFLSTPLSVWLGEISYAVYMCHMFVLKSLQHSIIGRVPDVLAAFIALGLTIMTAALCYRFIEIPCRRQMRRLSRFDSRAETPILPVSATAAASQALNRPSREQSNES